MKAKDVLKLLKISRITLYNYVKSGKLPVKKLHNGYYDYDDTTVNFLANNKVRYNVIYTRVSTSKQKNDLNTQLNYVKKYCQSNNIHIDHEFSDIDSGISLERKYFSKLIDMVLAKQINNIYISFKDRLSRLSFSLFQQLFSKFGTTIIIVSDILNNIQNSNDLFDDLTSLMHYFSTKKYSNHKKLMKPI